LAFYADRDRLLTELIDARLALLGLRDFSAYVKLLADAEKGSEEMELLVGQLTIGETYFFRDEGQFAAIRDIVLPDILKRNQHLKQLRIWSAGCATGAEPYSLAILLSRELAHRIEGWQISICASDLNRSYLARAAEGKFRPWALRSVSDEIKRECFTKDGNIWTIHPRYKPWISFHCMNLVGSEFHTPGVDNSHFDLILCRNVMIYFTPQVNQQLITNFHGALDDGGWLVVAAPEYNLEHYTAFRTVSAAEAKLYQKATPVPLAVLAVAEHAPAAPLADPPVVALAPAVPLAVPPVAALAPVVPVVPLIQPATPERPDTEGFFELADRGEWQRAMEYGHRLLAQDRLNPQIHFYQALIFEKLGEPGESERSLRQAIYLDRKFALAHYHLGLALQRDWRTREAERSFGNVLKVLAAAPDDELVPVGSGITVTALKELAKTQLEKSRGNGKA
jgi:chemotaxis protein methyltransferase CheR